MKIKMIVLSDCPKSQYYSKICVERWGELGYNIERFEGTTPDNLGTELKFRDEKFSGRPFTPTEKAIWYSHFRLWQTVTEPTYVIEHDTYPFRRLPDFGKNNFGLFSLFPRNHQAWLKMEEHISPGSGYYINEQGASILIDWALAMKQQENVDGHIHQTFLKLSGLKQQEFFDLYTQSASCFQIVQYGIGTSAEHNNEETNLSSMSGRSTEVETLQQVHQFSS
jgi:hypothetical protein